MVMRATHSNLWAVGSVLFACHGMAVAQETVVFRSGLSIAGDDNFLRSAANAAKSGERITTQSLGLQVKVPASRQSFELDAGISSNNHQAFTNFDYLAQNYRASMLWTASSALQGSLSTSRADTLNSAGDSLDPTLRNKNTTVNTNADLVYLLGGPWQLNAGLGTSASINERAVIGQNTETRANTARLGFTYSSSPGNVWSYSSSRSNGVSVADFQGTGHSVSLQCTPSGNLAWRFGVNYSDQTYASVPQNNSSGYGGSIGANWRLSGKVNLGADLQRASTAYVSATATSAVTDSFSLTPNWEISSKSAVRLRYKYAVRMDQGSPSGATSGRSDTTQDLSLAYTWTPRQFASLSTSLSHAQRASSAVNQDYVAHLLQLTAQFTF